LTVWAILFTLASALAAGPGEYRSLDTCVPAEAMAVYFGRPSPEMLNAPPGSVVDRLAGWLIALKRMGLIPQQGRVIADVAGTLPMLGRRPHTLVLLDITSKRIRPEVYRLKEMQAALVIDAEGMSDEFDRRIRDLLITYTDAENGRIDAVQAGEVSYHRLTDRRLPPWAVVEWGSVRRQLVVTFGSGVFSTMLDTLEGRSASLASDRWYARAHRRCRGATSGIEVFVDLARIRARVGEVVEGRPTEVLRALGLERAERLLWTVGFEGRALRSEVVAREIDGQDRYAMLTGKQVTSPEVASAVPPGATSYAAFRLPLPDSVRTARRAYLESQSPNKRRRWGQGWARLEQEFQFDVETGLIDQLGDYLVFHTYPRHPLALPMLGTIWIQVAGERAVVSQTVDGMMAAWQRYMNDPTDTRPAVSLSPRVRRDADGIWYLQLGLLGPAVAVADGWIVISFSPEAVRENLAYLERLREEG